jgi:hypothetical protein
VCTLRMGSSEEGAGAGARTGARTGAGAAGTGEEHNSSRSALGLHAGCGGLSRGRNPLTLD